MHIYLHIVSYNNLCLCIQEMENKSVKTKRERLKGFVQTYKKETEIGLWFCVCVNTIVRNHDEKGTNEESKGKQHWNPVVLFE